MIHDLETKSKENETERLKLKNSGKILEKEMTTERENLNKELTILDKKYNESLLENLRLNEM